MKFHYVTMSNAVPIVSDEDDGIIDAEAPVAALVQVVRNYKHPAGLFSAGIFEPSLKGESRGKLLARYLSKRAAAREKGIDPDSENTVEEVYEEVKE